MVDLGKPGGLRANTRPQYNSISRRLFCQSFQCVKAGRNKAASHDNDDSAGAPAAQATPTYGAEIFGFAKQYPMVRTLLSKKL